MHRLCKDLNPGGNISSNSIATSHDQQTQKVAEKGNPPKIPVIWVTVNNLPRSFSLFQGNLGWWNMISFGEVILKLNGFMNNFRNLRIIFSRYLTAPVLSPQNVVIARELPITTSSGLEIIVYTLPR